MMQPVNLTEAELASRAAARKATSVIAALIVILLAIWGAYSNSLGGVFVWDDLLEISSNPVMRHGSIGEAMFQGHSLPARPLPYLTFKLDLEAGGTLFRFHLVNLIFHAIAAFLVFALVLDVLRRTDDSKREDIGTIVFATVVAVIWSVHPLQTQAVTYVYQRIELMVSVFLLATLFAVSRSTLAHGIGRWFWSAVAVLACAAGMACKESMVVAPLVVLLYDRAFIANSWKQVFRERYALYVMLFCTEAVLFGVLWTQAGRYGEFEEGALAHTSWEHLISQPRVITQYLKLCLLPLGQNLEYGWTPTRSLSLLNIALGVPLLVALVTGLLLLARRPKVAFPILAFFLLLAPTSSVMPVMVIAAEHRMYLASVVVIAGLLFSARYVMQSTEPKIQMLGVVVATLVVAAPLTYLTRVRNELYNDRIAIWSDGVRKAPQSAISRGALGLALSEIGRDVEAEEHLRFADEFFDSASSKCNLAKVLIRLNKLDEATEILIDATRRWPERPEPLVHLGNVIRASDPEAAVKYYRRAIELNPLGSEARNNLGLLIEKTDVKEAEKLFNSAIACDPNNAQAYTNLGNLRAKQGRLKESLGYYEAALAINPGLQAAIDNRQVIRQALIQAEMQRRPAQETPE